MYLLFILGFQNSEFLRYDQLPGYGAFAEIVESRNQRADTNIVVHEECMPQFVQRLFVLAKAVLPEQRNNTAQLRAERDFVTRVIQGLWPIKFLFLEKQASEKLFYRNINTSASGTHIILFTNTEKLDKNMKYVDMDRQTLWEGLKVVVFFGEDNRQFVVFGRLS